MYFLLFGVHAVFFYIAHILGSVFFQSVFILLLFFFLLYFSPLFFSETQKRSFSDISFPSLRFSPKDSTLIPLMLIYFGIYVLVFTVKGDIASNFTFHISILLLIFLLFFGYILAFGIDSSFFRDALRFQLVCSYITLGVGLVYMLVFSGTITWIHLVFSLVTLSFSYFFFRSFVDEGVLLFLAFLLSILVSFGMFIVFLFPAVQIFTLLGWIAILSVFFFEYIEKISIFQSFTRVTREILGILIIATILILVGSSFFGYFSVLYFLTSLSVFLFSLHIRYSNYIAYVLGVFLLYFLYTYIFYELLLAPSLLSALLFIFFFPLCIIGNTYFWEEKYPYDFSILHYASISYAGIMSLYSLIFVSWGVGISLFLSCSLFLFAILFLLSYFRFQYH